MAISSRIRAAEAAFAAVNHFYNSSRYSERRLDSGISDFTFGNPHEMPLAGLVAAIRERAQPHDKNWFAYKSSESEPQAFVAEQLGRDLGLAFEPADIALTTGAFAAILVAVNCLLDPGDEAVFSEPAWFCYEPLLLAEDGMLRPSELVEDELILVVPVVAVMPGTEAMERDWPAQEEEQQQASPFAALAGLKKDR